LEVVKFTGEKFEPEFVVLKILPPATKPISGVINLTYP